MKHNFNIVQMSKTVEIIHTVIPYCGLETVESKKKAVWKCVSQEIETFAAAGIIQSVIENKYLTKVRASSWELRISAEIV